MHKNVVLINFQNERKHVFLVMLITAIALICGFTTSFARAAEPQPIIIADLFGDLQQRLEKSAREVINNPTGFGTHRVEQPVADQPVPPSQSPEQAEAAPQQTKQSKKPVKGAAIRQALPALPFIERDKEIDLYAGKWRLLKPFPLYDKEGGGTVIKTLPKGMKIDGLSLAVHTLSYAVAELNKPLTRQFSGDNFNQATQQRELFTIPLQRGDKIVYLSYFGEGECRVWVKGRTYIAGCFEDDDELKPISHYSGKTNTTHWALVRTPDGSKGWLWLKGDEIYKSIQSISKHDVSVE